MTKNEAVDLILATLPGWTACRLSELHLYRPDGTLGLVLSDRDVVAAAERITGRAIATLNAEIGAELAAGEG